MKFTWLFRSSLPPYSLEKVEIAAGLPCSSQIHAASCGNRRVDTGESFRSAGQNHHATSSAFVAEVAQGVGVQTGIAGRDVAHQAHVLMGQPPVGVILETTVAVLEFAARATGAGIVTARVAPSVWVAFVEPFEAVGG